MRLISLWSRTTYTLLNSSDLRMFKKTNENLKRKWSKIQWKQYTSKCVANCIAYLPFVLHINLDGHQHWMDIKLECNHAIHLQHCDIVRLFCSIKTNDLEISFFSIRFNVSITCPSSIPQMIHLECYHLALRLSKWVWQLWELSPPKCLQSFCVFSITKITQRTVEKMY